MHLHSKKSRYTAPGTVWSRSVHVRSFNLEKLAHYSTCGAVPINHVSLIYYFLVYTINLRFTYHQFLSPKSAHGFRV